MPVQFRPGPCPLLPGFAAGDPNTMYFVSRRDGPSSIYRLTFNGESRGDPEMVIAGYVGEPSMVADGSIMYFVHVLVDEEGVLGSDGEARNKPEIKAIFTIN